MELTQSTILISDIDRQLVQDLIQMNIDSRDGFAYASERLVGKHSALSMRFHRYSQQRKDFQEKLSEVCEMNHDEPTEQGSIAASLHRTWMELRDELQASVDISALVREARRGESFINQAYQTAIETVTDSRLRRMLDQQFESVKESYAWLSRLQDEGEGQRENEA
jgi:uncharacterized protein (TIGR02284 family)